MSALVLFGAGSPICGDVIETCRRNRISVVAAVKNVPGQVYVDGSIQVVDVGDLTDEIKAQPFVVPLSDSANRRIASTAAHELGFSRPVSLVDGTSIIASDCRIEEGVYVNAGVIVASASSLERFVFCNRGANIGHHCRIGAFVSIGPGAVLSGSVAVGESATIGSGAIILPKITIGSGAIIAAGAVVARDVADGGFAAGNPARILARPAKD